MAFLTDDARSALLNSIRAVEGLSSAEVVVAVEPRSARYLAASLLVAIAVALGVLTFLLFSPWPFDLPFFVIEPTVGGALIGFLVHSVPTLSRLFVPRPLRRAAVERAAKATFFDKGVRHTQDRIGLLIYASVAEREAVVLADDGLLAEVPDDVWKELAGAIEQAVRTGGDGVALAKAIEALAEPLGDYLPRSDDDVNELADEVHG